MFIFYKLFVKKTFILVFLFYFFKVAVVMKLVDMPDLGSGGVSHGGSSPSNRTINLDIERWSTSIKFQKKVKF